MQSIRKPVEKKPKDKSKDEKSKLPDEKIKKGGYNAATPRDFVQRSSAADIYAQKKKNPVQSTPRKVPGTSRESKVTPMKDVLRSSASSISQISNSSRISTSSKLSSVKGRTAKDLPFVNVTVNSPVAKRRLDLDVKTPRVKDGKTKSDNTREITKKTSSVNRKEKGLLLDRGDVDRQRSKTRTLNENEVKQLTPDKVDNNEEMINLKQKLVAKPKAFYVELDGDTPKTQPAKQSDEEVSYEDDFESYESDFDSYHSEKSNENTSDDAEHDIEKDEEVSGQNQEDSEVYAKEPRDEENMLDSGSFDLRDQRSAKSKPAAMEFILEGSEDDKGSSLDEGFQEGSSAVSSMRTVHVDVLDRPMFVDFNKSNEKRRKKIINEKLIQRAKDILSMVTLHEMSFTLFEMKPISYDLFMATFGRSNHTQIAVQTFDDGITEEVQTEEVSMDCKWTQHPVKFSKFDVYLNDETDIIRKKNRRNSEDYLSKFTFIFDKKVNSDEHDLETLKGYKDNPLRVLLEQKDGVGDCKILPHETYKNKLNPDFSMSRLGKFLKKVESNVNKVLSSNTNSRVLENVVKSAFPFSLGYIGITTKNVSDEKSFLKQSKIVGVIFSESKHNLVLTVHRKSTSGVLAGKSLICLWDASVARTEPIKMLIAVDNLVMGRFRGSTDGIFIAALEDGSMHLWDLSEVPSWRNVVSSKKNDLVEVKTESLTQIEKDREWNLKNSDAGYDQLPLPFAMQACAYTSSAANLESAELTDKTVGLEFVGDARQDGGRRVVGQICSLQRLGTLTIWTIVQGKTKTHDPGKAFWSKMKLERTQTISLTDRISAKEFLNDTNSIFNLNAGKKRMLSRKKEKVLARNFSRQNSTDSSRDRPSSVSSARKLPVEKIIPHSWESGMVCSDLRIMQYNGIDRYLVAKNYGEVLSCTRSLGALKVERLCVSSDTSPITCLEVSPGATCFLAATDSGTVHLYSVEERRVLLTLDCRSGTPTPAPMGPRADFRGSFVDTPKTTQYVTDTDMAHKVTVSSVLWSRVNPCCIFTLSHEGALGVWDLTHSDIYPKHVGGKATVACMAADGSLALVTPEGDVQVHRLSHERKPAEYEQLFHKYIALL